MPVSEMKARELLDSWTDNPSLKQHARSVEIAMRAAARNQGVEPAEVEKWGLTGLLHDADYDHWPTEHPKRIIAWLEEQGEPEMAHAVLCHFDLDTEPETPMAQALLACDELTGFIVACCLVRPEGIHTLSASSVKKKLKDRAFAAKVDRDVVRVGMERLGVDPAPHMVMIIEALREHAAELGIGGRETDG